MRYYIDLKRIGSIMRDPNYTDKEKVLAYIISDHCQFCQNNGKACELSYSIIRKWTGWNRNYISKTIKSLSEKGDITVDSKQLQGNRKTTNKFTSIFVTNTYVEEEWYQGGTNSGTKVVPGGSTKVVLNNKQEKQQLNNSNYSYSDLQLEVCGNDNSESGTSAGKDTTYIDEVGTACGKAEQPANELDYILDQLEWCIGSDVFSSDVSFDVAFDRLKKRYIGLDVNYDYLKDMFDRKNKQKQLLA